MTDEAPSDGEIDIQPLISKLGHEVEEIRVRSLKNIIFKLDHDLICIGDVVHKKELFIKLLEWFNFDPCSNQKEVLQLLEKLSKHSSGLETLVGIGAIEFLSHLRQDVDPSLYQLVDNVLNNLLSLPEILPDGEDEYQLLYYERGKSSGILESNENAAASVKVTIPAKSQETIHCSVDVGRKLVQLPNRLTEEQSPIDQAQYFDENPTEYRDHELHLGEVEGNKEGTGASWRYPWIRLADSDRHILSTTNTRLQSHNPSLVKKSCEFLNDVLFKDFPAEIFLQRPSIVMTLLTLLEVKSLENHFLPLSAASCLSHLCVHLKQRYLLVSDPAWYSLHPDCWKHWVGYGSSSSSATVSPASELSDLRTTGDGGERSSDSSKTESEHYVQVEEEDELVREALEMNQMSLEEFSLQVMRGCCPLLNTVGDPLILLEALWEALKLLQVSRPGYQWWNNYKIKPLRREICRVVARTLNTHMVKCGLQPSEAEDIVEHNISRHAMIVINTSLWIINFLGPFIQSEWDDESITQDLGEVFRALVINEIVFSTYPEIRTCLERCPFVMDDPEFVGVYSKALAIKTSLIASVKFLKEMRLKANVHQDVLIGMLEPCLLSLPYHQNLELITRAIELISTVFERSHLCVETKSKAKDILLSLLSNGDDVVRQKSYECCAVLVKDALKYSHVTNPVSSYCYKAMFVVDRDVLYTVCAFGIVDQNEQILEIATKILETFLENRLNMSSDLRKKLLDDLLTSLPFLQMHLDKRSKLGTCLMGLLAFPGESPHSLTADGEVVPFSQFERLRGSLRCMFLRDKIIRAKGYGYLIRRLVDEDLKTNREFVYPRGNLENSSDLFILETFASSIRLHRSTTHANFDDEKIRKLFDIVAMESTDVSLRKSSAEQLAVLMQDPDLHNVLLDIVAEDSLLGILEESLAKDGRVHISSIVNPKLELVPPCLKILRLLSEYNVRCRHKLAQNSSVYRLVVRHALLGPSGGTVRYEAACLLTLLLFDEVAKCPSFEERDTNGGDILFALPALFLKRYSLPFNPPLYQLSNPYQGDTPPEPDPLKAEPALSLLRVAWNLAWFDGTNEIPNDLTGKQDDVSEKLTWTSLDSQLLKCCSTKMAVPEAISSILTATSHHAVKLSVTQLSLHLLGENSMKRNQRTADREVRVRELFYSCDWKTAFERYFAVYPKSADDDCLLIETLKTFRYLIQESSSPPPISFLGWLARVIMAPDSSVVVLLSSPSPSKEQLPDASVSESKRMLRKELLEFLSIFVRKLRSLAKPWLWSGEMVYAGDFTLSLTLNLNLTDSPQYYDLPILESTLQCLVEITAIPCFSTASKFVDPKELCVELLSSLLQVFTAFHAGRLGAFTSFMGRGVTLCVSLCLVHLVHEMSSVLKLQDWPTLFATVADKESNSDVSWLSSMWTDHLPEVRWCSLAIATHVVTHTGSPLAIKQNFAGGLWNLAVIILMDGKECCLVRDQAILLFSALLSSLKRNGNLHEAETGLSVQTETEIISGVPALHLLLAHHQFYSSFRQMLRNVVFENSPQLPGTATFAESLSSNSTHSKYGIPYQSLDTDSQRSDSVGGRSVSDSTRMPSSSSSSHSGESSRRLLEESSATSSVVTSTAVSGTSRPSSTIPLITRSKSGSELGRNDVRSSNSPASMDSLEILAWVTPRFVGSLIGLVTNLVCVCPETVLNEVKDEDILGLFISQLDGKHAISLMTQLKNTSSHSRHRHLEINLTDTLDMYSEIAVLMKTCAAKDHIISHAIQQNTAILDRLLKLLAINSSKPSGGVQISCYKMWGRVVELLLMLLKRIKESQLLEIPLEEILLKHWKVFAAAFEHVMSTSELLRTCFLHLLSHVLLREGKRMTSGGRVSTSLAAMLDESALKKEEDNSEMMTNGDAAVHKNERKTTTDKKKDEFEGNGSELCSILLSTYQNLQEETATTNHNNEESHFVIAALRNLFCISQAAKKTAVKAGFLATSLDKIKQLHVQLNMESLEVGKASGTRKKEMDLISEIIKVLELLKNLVFRSNETKLEAIDDGVISVLQQLWSWCTVVKILRLAVLDLMCTLTARCSQASIAMSNTSTGFGSTLRLGPSNNTFVHCVIKMTSKMCNKLLNNSTGDGNLASCQILFSLLKNIAMASECRGILWKSNFITEFSRLKSLSHQKWKASHKTVVTLWLELLANIAFYRDGQQMIVKIDSVIPLLLEFSGSNTKKVNEPALLVLRNLCFHVPSKTLLLSNSEVVELLLRSVDKSSIYVRALASSALWALLTNNQKAKSILGKPALVVKRLSDSKHTLKATSQGSDVNTSEDIQRKHYEEAIENILKILRC